MSFRWLALMPFLVMLIRAQEPALIRVGETWHYFKGTNEPSSPSSVWRQLSFDDSSWLTGVAGFSSGFDEATQLTDAASRYFSVFFRKKFTVTDPTAIKWLVLRLDYDDGFVACLNGVEIARRGFTTMDAVAFNTPAVDGFRVYGAEIDVTSFTNLLQRGENVLAVQVHGASLDAPTLVFVPELLANFNRGPFVQNASTNSIQIIWRTPVAADSRVELVTNGTPGVSLFDTNLVTAHAVTLTNLLPDTSYTYRVSSSTSNVTATGPSNTFRTLKTGGEVEFVVFGDSGLGSLGQFQVADVVRQASPDLVLHVGDVMYPSFESSRADLKCLSVYAAHMRTTSYYFVFGNHDLYAGDWHFLETFYLPTNPVTGTEHFYSFDHGDVHFAALFVPMRVQFPTYPAYALTEGSPQYRWLTNDLATSSKPWKVLFFHVPVNTSGPHRFDIYAGTYDRLELQRLLLPIARQYGVQLILTGHDHAFERFAPMNGVHAIVTGGGGYALYGLAERDPASSQFWSAYHCTKVTVNKETMTIQALGTDGTAFDSMTIQRALPVEPMYQASWHSPMLESNPPDDGDGNIVGQRFDFIGESIPTMPGEFSNPGQVRVNNDALNLFIGFKQVMLYGDNNLFLFIESPRQTGVTNLIGVGNARVDPEAQGADGLDFLQNLSFTNFAPSVGCIVGDEYGDYQYRTFLRPGLGLNVGQGVFKLDAEISDVPGARLQQFNRPVQTVGVPGEQNADLIEVAIPLSALGGLQPGDVIKVGAVVGGPGFNTNIDQQTRQLDSSFLGRSLNGFGPGSVVLEGISIQLAPDPDPDHDGLTNVEEAALGTDPNKPDTDGDGLQDGWEVRSGLNPLIAAGVHGANGDIDDDGHTNSQEQLAGTDPRDPASALRLVIASLTSGVVHFSWSAVPGKRYQLEFSTNLQSGFSPHPDSFFPRTADLANETFDESLGVPDLSDRFYRIRLVP